MNFAIIWWLTLSAKAQYPDSVGLVLGIASFLGFGPMVVTSLFAGVFVDRWNRKIVIAAVDSLEALFAGILMILFFVDEATIPIVLGILALRSMMQGFHNPAIQAIIPLLIPRDKLTQINSIEYLTNGIIFLIGPVIGATLIEWWGLERMAEIQAIDIITFVIAVIPLFIIYIPDITNEKRESDEKSFIKDFKEGIVFIKETDGLLTLLSSFTVLNFMLTPVEVLLPLIVISPIFFNGGAQILAFYLAAFQGGSIIASVIFSGKKLFVNNAKGVAVGQFMMYIGLFTLISSTVLNMQYLLYAAGLISGLALPIANVSSQTVWQSVVPLNLQGRVMSVRMVIAWVLNPISMLLAGYFADILNPVLILLIGGIIGFVYLFYAWFGTNLPIVEQILGLEELPN